MFNDQLKREIVAELACMRQVIKQVELIRANVARGAVPGACDTAAAGLFLSQFYMGVENVLKRICRSRGLALPSGPNWHVALLDRFRPDASEGCPAIVDDDLYADLDMYRRYRHVVVHSYAFTLIWAKLVPGLDSASGCFARFEAALGRMLDEEGFCDIPGVREEAVPYATHHPAPVLAVDESSALTQIKRRVAARFAIRECVLFGARLREGFESDMDTDLLIVAECILSPGDHSAVAEIVREENMTNSTLFSVLCVSADDWYGSVDELSSLRGLIASGGVVV